MDAPYYNGSDTRDWPSVDDPEPDPPTDLVRAGGLRCAAMTVRDRIADIQRALRDDDPSPMDLRGYALELVGLLGNVQHEVTEAELAFTAVLMHAYKQEAKANRAKVIAECSPEYARLRTAKDAQRLALEMVRVIKAVMRSSEEEQRLTR